MSQICPAGYYIQLYGNSTEQRCCKFVFPEKNFEYYCGLFLIRDLGSEDNFS